MPTLYHSITVTPTDGPARVEHVYGEGATTYYYQLKGTRVSACRRVSARVGTCWRASACIDTCRDMPARGSAWQRVAHRWVAGALTADGHRARAEIRGGIRARRRGPAFAAAVQTGAPFPTTADDGVRNMTVIDSIYTEAGLAPRGTR